MDAATNYFLAQEMQCWVQDLAQCSLSGVCGRCDLTPVHHYLAALTEDLLTVSSHLREVDGELDGVSMDCDPPHSHPILHLQECLFHGSKGVNLLGRGKTGNVYSASLGSTSWVSSATQSASEDSSTLCSYLGVALKAYNVKGSKAAMAAHSLHNEIEYLSSHLVCGNARLLAISTLEEQPCLVFPEGNLGSVCDLANALRTPHSLEDLVLRIVLAVDFGSAVVCNESQGIFSCDLKGSNVIVSLRKTRHAMAFLGTELIDFESAMDVSSREERVPHSVFSKGDSPYEQQFGLHSPQGYTIRAEYHAFLVIVAHLLCGVHPIKGPFGMRSEIGMECARRGELNPKFLAACKTMITEGASTLSPVAKILLDWLWVHLSHSGIHGNPGCRPSPRAVVFFLRDLATCIQCDFCPHGEAADAPSHSVETVLLACVLRFHVIWLLAEASEFDHLEGHAELVDVSSFLEMEGVLPLLCTFTQQLLDAIGRCCVPSDKPSHLERQSQANLILEDAHIRHIVCLVVGPLLHEYHIHTHTHANIFFTYIHIYTHVYFHTNTHTYVFTQRKRHQH